MCVLQDYLEVFATSEHHVFPLAIQQQITGSSAHSPYLRVPIGYVLWTVFIIPIEYVTLSFKATAIATHRLKTLLYRIRNTLSDAIELRVLSSYHMNLIKFACTFWCDTDESGQDEGIRR